MGVDQKRVTQFIPGERDPLIVRIETLGPKITRVARFTELRVDNRDSRVEKLGIDRAHYGGLQSARHGDVVGIDPPAVFR